MTEYRMIEPIALAAGLVVAGLSWIFNSLARQYVDAGGNGTVQGNIMKTLHMMGGAAAIGLAALITTDSFQYTFAAAGMPVITWAALHFLKIHGTRKRRNQIAKELPVLLDYLVLQVESGHSIQQALRGAPGLFGAGSYLYEGLRELDHSLHLGSGIVQALGKLAGRLDTEAAELPIMAMAQAVRHGTPLANILRSQSKKMKDDLILEGEQFANMVSIKILIPLLVFIFPASFLVIFSPVIVSLSEWMP